MEVFLYKVFPEQPQLHYDQLKIVDLYGRVIQDYSEINAFQTLDFKEKGMYFIVLSRLNDYKIKPLVKRVEIY